MKGHKTKEERKEEKAREKLAEDLYKTLPVVNFDEELNLGIMEDGTFIDCFEIICKDLNGLTKDQLLMDTLSWDKVYKTYPGDLKIISFSFPTDTKRQVEYLDYKIETTENPIYRSILEQKKEMIELVHLNFLTREAALFFFAKNPTEYKNNYINLYTTLSRSSVPLARKMEKKKKKQLFYKLCNKNLNH